MCTEKQQIDHQKLINELRNELEQAIVHYLDKITDFAKWTSTITLGAFLWIGTNFNYFGNILWLTVALILFCFAIVIPFFYVIYILYWMKNDTDLKIGYFESAKSSPPNHQTAQVGGTQPEIISKLLERAKNLYNLLNHLKWLLIFHALCLFGGAISLLLAILFH